MTENDIQKELELYIQTIDPEHKVRYKLEIKKLAPEKFSVEFDVKNVGCKFLNVPKKQSMDYIKSVIKFYVTGR